MKVAICLVVVIALTGALGRPSKESTGKRLIKVSEQEPAQWLSQDQIHSLIQHNTNFMDITDHQVVKKVQNLVRIALPKAIQFDETVKDVITKLSNERMLDFITTFSTFHNRYYTAASGVESSEWLLATVSDFIAASPYAGQASAKSFEHTWAQTSVIARIEGSDPTLKSEVIVLGAHCDSVSSGSQGRAPGADDDASGSVVLLETFRALLESDFLPKRSIEFQWYAAEEVGLRGSQDIAEAYADDEVQVVAMLNFDVVGWSNGEEVVALVTDYTDADLTDFVRTVVDAYLAYGYEEYRCGYACSDHASWTANGYPAAFPVERETNPYMHTTQDTVDRVNFDQVKEFAKLAVGFAIELAEPSA